MTTPALASQEPLVALLPDRLVQAIERVAVRFVSTWGFTTVAMVASRVARPWRSGAQRAALAREALAEMPDLVWLDGTHEWFTLVDRAAQTKMAIEKIFAATGRPVLHADLVAALSKRRSFANAPAVVVHRFVSAMAARARRGRPGTPAARLTRDEQVVRDVLRESGGSAELRALLLATAAKGLAPAVAKGVLKTSPLFLRCSRGLYRLIGAASGASGQVTLAGSTTIVAPIQ